MVSFECSIAAAVRPHLDVLADVDRLEDIVGLAVGLLELLKQNADLVTYAVDLVSSSTEVCARE
jgi:hypothetical protein